MHYNEYKKNLQPIINKLESSQGHMEEKAYDILNEADLLIKSLNEINKALSNSSEENTMEEASKLILLFQDRIPMVLSHALAINEASHALEEKTEKQKELIKAVQEAMDYIIS